MMLIMFYFEGRSIIIENSFESLSSSIYYCFWYISWNSADRYIPFLVQRLYRRLDDDDAMATITETKMCFPGIQIFYNATFMLGILNQLGVAA